MNNNLSQAMALVKPSATLVINELSSKLAKEGKEIFKFGFGQSPFPVPKKVVKALQENAFQKDYLPVRGLPQLRVEVADFFVKNYGLKATADDVLIGPGSKELIYDFQIAYNIDELLLPNPSWVSYEPQGHLAGHKVTWLNTTEENDWKIRPSDIESHCRKNPGLNRTMVFNYPSNPLGVTYSEEELKALAEVFRKYNIIIIADEIYGEVHHDGAHQTLAAYYPEGTIISSGLSKWAGAGGWRLGIFVIPENMRYVLDAMAIVASETFTTTSAPIQYAAVEAYRQDESILFYLARSRKILKAVGLYVYNELSQKGVTMPKPEGGFYLFPNFNKWKIQLNKRGVITGNDFCNVLLEEAGVALLPGQAFGHPRENFTARLSFVDFDGAALLKILEEHPEISVDENFVKNYCPKIITGVQKMGDWLTGL